MIALRLLQVIAERTRPVTPELVEAFSSCLKGMERFAQVAGVGKFAGEAGGAPPEGSEDPGQSAGGEGGSDGVIDKGENEGLGASAPVTREVEDDPSKANGHGGANGYGGANGRGGSDGGSLA